MIKVSVLNLPLFIYNKLKSSSDKSNISSRIIKIAIFSVFLGVFISLCSISIGKGLQISIKDKLYSLNPDLVVSTYENNLRGIASEKINNIDEVDFQIRDAYPDLKIEYLIEKPTLISNNNSFESVIFKGVSSEYDLQKLNKFISKSKISDKLSNNEIIISGLIANKLDIEEGDDITLYFQTSNNQRIPNVRSYSVKHIFDSDFPDFDNNYLIGNAQSLQSIFKWESNDYSIIEISSNNKTKIFDIESSIRELKSIEKNNLSVKSITTKYENIFSWVSIFDFNIIVITVLMVFIAIVSVTISIFTLIFERVKMIGILSSLGANEASLSKIFIYQGINIILKGMIPANIFFIIISIIQNKFKLIKLNPNDYYMDSIPFIIDPVYIILLNSIFIIMTINYFIIYLCFSDKVFSNKKYKFLMKYFNNIIETIGNTPLIKLNSITKSIKSDVFVKVESFNPGNSVKDRMAIKMIEDAEKEGKLKPGGTIVEGTSGNTGMGLALAAIVKGYNLICVSNDKQSKEKFDVLRAMGAKVVVCPTDVEASDPRSYYSVSKRISLETKNSWYVNQYHNPSNTLAHYESTGPEIWDQTDGKIDHFLVGVGTGGTISGVGKFLKEKKSSVKVWGIDTYGSVLKNITKLEYLIETKSIHIQLKV